MRKLKMRKMDDGKITDEDAFKSPITLRFGNSSKKSSLKYLRKKIKIILSPDKSLILKISLEKVVIDLEHEEDIYDFHSLSLR